MAPLVYPPLIMGDTSNRIDDPLRAFIEAQRMFFVATAPLAEDGLVNLSPKGMDTFRILAPDRVAYLDLTGSGNETAAHVAENGRITFLFCAFSGKPKILRLYGRGRVVSLHDEEWPEASALFPDIPGARQVIVVNLHRVATSCGFGIPIYEYQEQRDTLVRWAEAKGEDGLAAYRQEKNARSLDGLPTAFEET